MQLEAFEIPHDGIVVSLKAYGFAKIFIIISKNYRRKKKKKCIKAQCFALLLQESLTKKKKHIYIAK